MQYGFDLSAHPWFCNMEAARKKGIKCGGIYGDVYRSNYAGFPCQKAFGERGSGADAGADDYGIERFSGKRAQNGKWGV